MSGPPPEFRLPLSFLWHPSNPPKPPRSAAALSAHRRGEFFLFFFKPILIEWLQLVFGVGCGCSCCAPTSPKIRAELSRLAAAWLPTPVPRRVLAEFKSEPLGVSGSVVRFSFSY